MTVSTAEKQRRRSIVAAHVDREYRRTGRTAYEQWLTGPGNVAPIHKKINRRVEIKREQIHWSPIGSAAVRRAMARDLRDQGLV